VGAVMNEKSTLIEQVMSDIKSRIDSRAYAHGSRLPSVRSQAKAMHVSVSTVVEAYERLVAEGLLVSRPGSGFYVSGPVAPLALQEIEPAVTREIDPVWLSRQAIEEDESTLRPGCGRLPPEWLFEQGMRRALRSLARSDAIALTEYAIPQGNPALRQLLCRRQLNLGIISKPEQILLTESGTQAIDLICRFLLEPGDSVLIDDPCYFNFHTLLKAHRVNAVAVTYTPNGPDLSEFKKALEEHSPRLYITNSGVHNPTGACMTPAVAHQLLKLAELHDLIIVEDDIFADFEIQPIPRLAAFDGLNRVIQVGSFSKTISASVRCGYIAARQDWLKDLVDLKVATNLGSSRLASEIILKVLKDAGYRKHVDTIKARLAVSRVKTIQKLAELNIHPWLEPAAGMFIWCELPNNIDATDVAKASLKQGVVLAPGPAFSHSTYAKSFMRFNVAQCDDKKIFELLKKEMNKRD
tara:strand:- start:22222 stop:23622 length:1401 start_codon:yes stop_codon:yes gene_type:complete